MFATIAGGYSRKPLPGLPDLLGDAERERLAGRLDHAGYEAVADDFVREILAEMEVVQLGILGEGGVRARDRVLPWIEGLDGLSAGGTTAFPDGEPATIPVVTGAIGWSRPVTVRDWEFADSQSDQWVKASLVGPYSLAALAEPAPGRRRRDLALQFGEALNQEVRALMDAGCALVEVDESLALQLGDDPAEWATVRDASMRLAAGIEGEDAPHLSLGLWAGEIDAAGYAPLIDLPYRSYLVNVLQGPSAWRFIGAVPPDRGIVVGSADAQNEHLDETEVHVWAMAWAARGERGSQRVGCAPSGGLWSIGRHFAHRKCMRLGEAVKIGSMGPLQEVAEALDADPARSKMPELRAMAMAVAEATGA